MPTNIDHPMLLAVIAVVCMPVLLFTARFFFDDMETFLEELGYRAQDDIWWKLIRMNRPASFIWIKIVGFLGTYLIVVGGLYLSVSRLAK